MKNSQNIVPLSLRKAVLTSISFFVEATAAVKNIMCKPQRQHMPTSFFKNVLNRSEFELVIAVGCKVFFEDSKSLHSISIVLQRTPRLTAQWTSLQGWR